MFRSKRTSKLKTSNHSLYIFNSKSDFPFFVQFHMPSGHLFQKFVFIPIVFLSNLLPLVPSAKQPATKRVIM